MGARERLTGTTRGLEFAIPQVKLVALQSYAGGVVVEGVRSEGVSPGYSCVKSRLLVHYEHPGIGT